MSDHPPVKENFLLNLVANIVAPAVILSNSKYLSKNIPAMSPSYVLLIALAFPIVYFLYDYIRRKQVSPISVLGFVGTLASGGIGLMKIDPFWFAVKEGSMPLVFTFSFYVTLAFRKPMARAFVWHDALFATSRIESAIAERGTAPQLDAVFVWVTHRLAALFACSGMAQFVLARYLVTTGSSVNETEYNEQVGKFTWAAYFIMIPMLGGIIWISTLFMRKLREISGLSDEQLMRN